MSDADRPPDHDAVEFELDHINDLTATGRTNWFALTGYLAFALITTLGVQDVDFFVDSRRTTLPVIQVSIPTFSFFAFAPILGAALYAYLHHHVRKVSEALVVPPPVIDGVTLEERVQPWLLNDFILRRRKDGAIRTRPLDRLTALTTHLLVWWAGPLVLALMWFRTWPAHTLWLSAIGALCVMATVYSGSLSWAKLKHDIRTRGAQGQYRAQSIAVALLCIPVAWLTLANSKGYLQLPTTRDERTGSPDLSLSERAAVWVQNRAGELGTLDAPDLAGAGLARLPPEHVNLDAARHRYRTDFCGRRGIDAEICGRTPTPDYSPSPNVVLKRNEWCADREQDAAACEGHFRQLDAEFTDEWRKYRTAMIAALEKPSLRSNDLRSGNLFAAELSGIRLQEARLEQANLGDARLERAALNGARLQGADLRAAQLEGANLSKAQLQGADLRSAMLQDAILIEASLQGADMMGARLHGADLLSARLQDANLGGVRLEGADLWFARMQGANLWAANLDGANLLEANMQRTHLRETQLSRATLVWADLSYATIVDADFASTDITLTRFDGSALRRVDLQYTDFSADPMQAPNLRNSFGDATVRLPEGIPRPCQWARRDLTDEEFFARWRGWLERAPDAPPWEDVVHPVRDKEWLDVGAVPPEDSCEWRE